MDQNDKQIRIKATLDQTDFDQQINQLQRKLQNLQQKSQAYGQVQDKYSGGQFGKRSEAFFGEFNRESINNLREAFNLNARKLQHESRELREKERELQKLGKIETTMNLAQESKVKSLKEEIKLIKEKGQEIVRQNTAIASTAQKLGSDFTGFKGMTPTAPPSEQQKQGWFGQLFDRFSNPAAIGGAAVAVGRGAMMTGQIVSHRASRDRMYLQELAQQTQIASQPYMSYLQGQGGRTAYEAPERQKALEMAIKEMGMRRISDIFMKGGSALGQVGIGVAAGAGLGSIIPGLGTGIGAAIGGTLGLGRALGDRTTWNMMFDPKAYQQQLTTDAVRNFQSNVQAQRAMQPQKFAAESVLNQNWQRFQQVERAVGLPFEGGLVGRQGLRNFEEEAIAGGMGTRDASGNFVPNQRPAMTPLKYGGLNETIPQNTQEMAQYEQQHKRMKGLRSEITAHNARVGDEGWYARNMDRTFSRERIEQAATQLLQSGAPTEFVKGEGAKFVAQMQRLGMTQAGAQVGAISGVGMGDQRSEEAYKKIIAEGMSIGIENSGLLEKDGRLGEDMRRFVSISTQLFTNAGGMAPVADFASGLIGMGGRELQASTTAYGKWSQYLSQGEGYRGALKWAAMAGDPDWEGVPLSEKNWAVNADPRELVPEDPRVKSLADRWGVSPEEAIKKIIGWKEGSVSIRNEFDKKKEAFRKGYKDFLASEGEWDPAADSAALRKKYIESEEGGELLRDASQTFQMETGDKTSYPELKAEGGIWLKGVGGSASGDITDIDKAVTRTKGITDLKEEEKAVGQVESLNLLNNNLDDLSESVRKSNDLTHEQVQALITLNTSIETLSKILKDPNAKLPVGALEALQKPIDMFNDQPQYGVAE